MKHCLIAILVLVLQEVVTLNTVIFETHRGIHNPWAIHLIFLVVTALDIWIGYAAGKWVRRTYNEGRAVRFIQKWVDRFEGYAGKRGKRAALFALGFVNPPYINSFIASWLDVSFWEMFIYIYIYF